MTRKRGIQYDTVAAVANGLYTQGFAPAEISAGAIREETGTGSLSTINTALKRWRSQVVPAAPGVELTADRMAGVAAAVTVLINEANERAREEASKANAATAVELAQVRAERDEALAINEEIEAERVALVAEVEAMRAEVDVLRLSEASLTGELKGHALALAVLQQATGRGLAEHVEDAAPEISTANAVDEQRTGGARNSVGNVSSDGEMELPSTQPVGTDNEVSAAMNAGLEAALAAALPQPRLFGGDHEGAPGDPS